MGKPKSKVIKVRVKGPLEPFADPFKTELKASGYTQLTIYNEMKMISHLSNWLQDEHFSVVELTADLIDQFITARFAAGYSSPPSRTVLIAMLAVLEVAGVVNTNNPKANTSEIDVVLDSFLVYLLNERGLATSTAIAYVDKARRFLKGCTSRGMIASLSAQDVTDAISQELAVVTVGAVQYFVAGLRSFLRFCFIEGLTPTDLSGAALGLTGRRKSALPKGISRSDAFALLASCDRRSSDGLRDLAILLILIRLGLRSSEVANLMLDDIDWRAGQFIVHGKGGRDDLLPLPSDVGEAIANYCQRGRQKSTLREVFLRRLAPIGGLERSGVSFVVRRACKRAGVAPIGAHRLRHSLACDMLAAGASLPEISQILRHTSISSTAIYAKVDLNVLQRVAMPWPGISE